MKCVLMATLVWCSVPIAFCLADEEYQTQTLNLPCYRIDAKDIKNRFKEYGVPQSEWGTPERIALESRVLECQKTKEISNATELADLIDHAVSWDSVAEVDSKRRSASTSTQAKPNNENSDIYSRSEAYNICIKNADANDFEMIDCAVDEDRRQDGNLNELYLKKMASDRPNFRIILKASQRAWIAYHDSTCQIQSGMFEASPGSMDHLSNAECIIDMTIERENWLAKVRADR